jgi:hypothetical protein
LTGAARRAYVGSMRNRSSKREDLAETAFRVVGLATGTIQPPAAQPEPDRDALSAAAAALGRLGGLKGGKARAAALSPAKRRAIATKAATVRWRRKASS